MSDLQQQIADLERLRDAQPSDSPVRASFDALIAQLRATPPPQTAQSGGVNLGSAQIGAVGDVFAGSKFVTQFFGGEPGEDGARLLRDYLIALLDDNRMLRLSRMTERRQSGAGQDLLPPLNLQDVFTSLTTDGPPIVVHRRERPAAYLHKLMARLKLEERMLEACAPEDVRRLRIEHLSKSGMDAWSTANQRYDGGNRKEVLAGLQAEAPNALLTLSLYRSELAIEAAAHVSRLVLLGAPGSGKSTVLRYLALLLAQHQLNPEHTPLSTGWKTAPTPVLCPLGAVATAVEAAPPGREAEALWGALEMLLDGGGVRQGLGKHLRPALRTGAAVLLFDGLDELPSTPGLGSASPRARMSRAIQSLARTLPRGTAIIVTCRTLPYSAPPEDAHSDWRLPPDDGWQTRTIQPLAFGQVRQFVGSWYSSACGTPGAIYTPAEGATRAASLLEQLERSPRLRRLIESPLLLTMLAILHYNREAGEIPRDRARLYDECVQLLLERWEPVRTPEMRRDGLLQRLGIADRATTDDLRAVLHRVALEAHRRLPEPGDGRGVLRGTELDGELLRFFRRLQCDRVDERLQTFTIVLREDAGLLHELGDDAYAFPHLTFQEFLAACALANDPDLLKNAYVVWSSDDGDRWREVLLLMAGRLRQQGKVETQGVLWLQALLRAKTPAGKDKTPHQRRQDALLAVDSYQEWEGRASLVSIEPDELEGKLTRALLPLLAPEPLAPLRERLAAAIHLGRLGDPRRGVSRLEPDWCLVPAGPFLLGSADDDEQARSRETPQRSVNLSAFRISRYLITNIQWQRFIEAGGYQDSRWWSTAGWAAKAQEGWTHPAYWSDSAFNNPSQPVIGVSWYEATAFCRWLTVQLGYRLRLPTEAEWEKAARGTDGRIFPWGNEWDAARANTVEGNVSATTPVGCYPNGASPYGAHDLSGNAFEWTATPWIGSYQHSDGTAHETDEGSMFVWRGGAWSLSRSYARCAYRAFFQPWYCDNFISLRVVAPIE